MIQKFNLKSVVLLGVIVLAFFMVIPKQSFAATLGNATIAPANDSGDSGSLNATKFTMPNESGTATSISVYIASPVSNSPNNQYQLAIYSDSGGSPSSLIAATSTGNLVADSWNTLSISASLSANAVYWLGYNSNGISSTNNFRIGSGSSGQLKWHDNQAFGSMPSSFGTISGSSATTVSIYVTYTPSGGTPPPPPPPPSPTPTPTPTPVPPPPPPPSGTIFYIRDGGTSSTCADWTNACDALPSALTRGATYYIADGAYPKWTLTSMASGSTLTNILKATVSAHGTSTGWSDAYGDGEAVIAGLDYNISGVGYLKVDGANTTCGFLTAHSSQACGIKFAISNLGDETVNFLAGGNNSIFTRVEIVGPAGDSTAEFNYGPNDANCFTSWGGGATDTVISHSWLHGCSTVLGSNDAGSIAEYNDISDAKAIPGDQAHENIWFIGFQGHHLTFRYNRATNYDAEGIFITWYSTPATPPHHIYVYGNIFSSPNTDYSRGLEIRQEATGAYNNIHFYNNVCYRLTLNCINDRSSNPGAGATSSFAYNNLDYNAGGFSCGNMTCATNSVVSTDPFVSASTGNFHLLAATTAGTTLAAPYNADPDGVIRGSSGVWDLGAYEFGGTPPANQTPTGSFDEIRLSDGVIRGWSVDMDASSTSNQVKIYIDGTSSTGTLLTTMTTNTLRSDVNTSLSISGNHGFEFTIPSQYRNNVSHSINVYGVDTSNSSITTLLTGSPKSFTLSGTTPVVGDINSDHIVNSIDYSLLNAKWFTTDATCDLNHDGLVNAIDYSILNSNWFKTW